MELEVFARIVHRWWLGLVIALVVGSLIGFTFAESRTPVYQAGTDLLIGPLSADTNILRASGQTAQTYAELASASSTLDVVAVEFAGVSDATVTAIASDVTRILKIRVRVDDAGLAAGVANAIATELERVASAEVAAAQVAGGSADPNVYRVGEVRVLEVATAPTTPISPNKRLITALGGLSMLVTIAVAVIAYEYNRQAVRVIGDVDRIVPGGVFGRIERSGDPTTEYGDRIAVLRSERSPTAISLSGLSIDLASHVPPDGANAALVFGGLAAGDRSGDVAVNVAAALASTGRSVALIDADETNREIRDRLSSVCEHPAEPLEVHINQTAMIALAGRYAAIDSGVLDVYSTEMIKLPDRSELEISLADLGAGYDHIVLHTAPAFGSPAAVRWSAAAGGTVLVVTSEVASARTVDRCVMTLSRGARHFIGVVFDERPRLRLRTPLLRRLFGGGARVGSGTRSKAPAAVGSTSHQVAQSSGQS